MLVDRFLAFKVLTTDPAPARLAECTLHLVAIAISWWILEALGAKTGQVSTQSSLVELSVAAYIFIAKISICVNLTKKVSKIINIKKCKHIWNDSNKLGFD